MRLNKKADGAVIVLIIILIILVLGWWYNISQRECDDNNDCDDNYYCGSDFECHEIPIVTEVKNGLLLPSIIIGIAIIIGAVILRYKIS